VDDKVLSGLNSAVHARRLLRSRDHLAELIVPIAEELLIETDNWEKARTSKVIVVSADLSGSKLECEFKRFQCTQQGPERVWKPIQSWKGEVAVETKELISQIHLPAQVTRLHDLREDLLTFVEQVDIPDLLRTPETSPALTP
jgi:hypothetical protein